MTVDEEPKSIIGETLKAKIIPLLAAPNDPKFVYKVDDFPPLSAFDISVICKAIVVPSRLAAECRKKLRSVLLHRPKVKVICPLDSSDKAPNGDDPKKYRKLVLVDRDDVFETTEIAELLEQEDCCKGKHHIRQSYIDWSTHETLTRILPVQFGEIPSAFETVGHLAHINLKTELLPFKHIIGKVLLDKNSPRIKTVVNKIGTIENEYRTFGMEVIAGSQDPGWSEVIVNEEKCHFSMDFRTVYWNSRLGGEHRRLTNVISKYSQEKTEPLVVADLMAGIGPFALPLSSRGYNISVHANDLNPDSYKYLVINSKRNKCKNLFCYNMDARTFCLQLQERGIDFHHVLMNLPASAPEFLDAFRGFRGKTLPRVHVHCFAPKDYEEAEKVSIERCETALGSKLDRTYHEVSVFPVRNVSPKKNMYCVSFNLPKEVRNLPAIGQQNLDAGEPDAKRKKLDL
jgi:tRNA (guanine37-N1)-methyltransferase